MAVRLLLALALITTTFTHVVATHTAYGRASLKLVKKRCNVTGTFASDYYIGREGDGRVMECMTYCFDTVNLDHNPFKMHVRSREGKFYKEEKQSTEEEGGVVVEESDLEDPNRYEVRGYKADVSGEREKINEKVLLNNGKHVCNW